MNHRACWWLSPTYGMASQVWRDLKAACAPVKGIRITEHERRIDFPGGGWLAIRSTHTADYLRGAGLDFVVLDEAAFMDASVWPEVVRPMLLEHRGRALFLSSPNGLNWFWELYQLGLRPCADQPDELPLPFTADPSLPVSASDSIGSPPTITPFLGDSSAKRYSGEAVSDASQPGGEVISAPTDPEDLLSLSSPFHRLRAGGLGIIPSAPPLREQAGGWGKELLSSPPRHRMARGLGGEVSSPSLRSGEGVRGWGLDRRCWRSFHYPSAANPIITPDELDSIRQQTSERVWRAEYLAEFTADVGQVFRGIREAATAPIAVSPIPGVRYICGLDWGRENDATAIVVIRADTRQMVALDRFNQVSWSLQRGRLKAIHDRWHPAAIWAEANSIGSPNIEALAAEGLPVRPFTTTAKSKPPLIEDLALAIERAQLALLPDETLLAELASYTMERLPIRWLSLFRPLRPP